MARWFGVWFLLTVALCLWRWHSLTAPPYWDYLGLWREGLYHFEHRYDYHSLLYDEIDVFLGGARTYVISVVPPLIALAFDVLPSTTAVLLVYHLAYFGVAAALLLLLFAVVRPAAGTAGALLTTVAFLATPTISAHIEMTGMELPVALLGLAGFLCIARGRYLAAAPLTLAGFFFKATGLLFLVANTAFLSIVAAYHGLQGDRGQAGRAARGLAANALATAIAVFLMRTYGVYGSSQGRTAAFQPWSAWIWSPDLTLLALFAALVALVDFLARARESIGAGAAGWRGCVAAILKPVIDAPIVWMCLMVIAATWVAMQKLVFVPRYLVISTALVYAVIGLVVFSSRRFRGVAIVGACLLIAVQGMNQCGALYPPTTAAGPGLERMGCFLERSSEYWADQEANLRLAEYLAKNHSADAVIGPAPYTTFLSQPRAGYIGDYPPVKQLYAIELLVEPRVRLTRDLLIDRPPDPVLVYVPRQKHLNAELIVPPPDADDLVLFNDQHTAPIVVYRRRGPDGTTPSLDDWDDWYVEHMYPAFAPQTKTMLVATDYLRVGRGERARAVIERYLEKTPNDVPLLATLAGLLLKQGETDAALNCARRAVELDPNLTEARDALGAVHLARGELDRALTQLDCALQIKPDDESSLCHKASCLLRMGRVADAESALEQALRSSPASFDAHHQLGLLRLNQNRPEEAEKHLRAALAKTPLDAETNRALAMLALKTGRFDEATKRLEVVAKVRPDDADALKTLGDLALNRRDYPAAVDRLEAALRVKPDHVEARASLAVALRGAGRHADAVKRYRQVLHVVPQWHAGANELAWMLSTHPDASLRNGPEGVRLAESACRQTKFQDPGYLDTLAAAYAETGDFTKAVETLKQALALPGVEQNAARREDFRARLALYERKEPYRQKIPVASVQPARGGIGS